MNDYNNTSGYAARTRWIGWVLAAWLMSGAFYLHSTECRAEEPVAQETPPPGYLQPIESTPNLARINVGLGLYNFGFYNCNNFYSTFPCTSGSYISYVPFILGVQVDIHLGDISYLSPGFQAMTGSADSTFFNGAQYVTISNHITLWEPSLDYVGKIGSRSREILGRFRLGGAVYFGSDGNSGGAFRIGGGVSFFNTRKIGIGLDIVFEGGSYHNNWFGGTQLLASPEFHF